MASKHIHIDRSDSYVPTDSQMIGEDVTHKWDFSREATRRGTTVSSVAWSKDNGESATISNEALASSVASAQVSGSSRGISFIKTTCTFADGSTRDKYLKLTLLDPGFSGTDRY